MDIVASDNGPKWKLTARSERGAEYLGLSRDQKSLDYDKVEARKICRQAKAAGLDVSTE
jgi:hypothetical protein